MATLTVTVSTASATSPSEAQLDAARNSLLTFFNTTKVQDGNLLAGGFTYASIGMPATDAEVTFGTGSDVKIGHTAGNFFRIRNVTTNGDLVFQTRSGSTDSTAMALDDSANKLILGNDLYLGSALGSTAYKLFYLLSAYRKPQLIWNDNDSVYVDNNTPTANESMVVFPDRICKITGTAGSLRYCSFLNTANGYDAGHSGAAVSGKEVGLTRSDNTWFYIYFVRVRYGTDADGTKYILVISGTHPLSSNHATLDTTFGAGAWVYAGAIRNGYGDGVSDGVLVPFRSSADGSIHFTETSTNLGRGVTYLASSTDADSAYTVALGSNGNQIPSVASEAMWIGYRATKGFAFVIKDAATNTLYRAGTSDDADDPNISLWAPVVSGHTINVERIDVGAVAKKIYLAAFKDHYK